MTANDALLALLAELRLRIASLEQENAQLRQAEPPPQEAQGGDTP